MNTQTQQISDLSSSQQHLHNANSADTLNDETFTSRRTSNTLQPGDRPRSVESSPPADPTLPSTAAAADKDAKEEEERNEKTFTADAGVEASATKEADHNITHNVEDAANDRQDNDTNEKDEDDDDEQNYLPMGPRLILIVVSLVLTVFCVALDNTILSVAIPSITDEFHRLDHVGWYAAVYLLTTCAFQLFFGKLYTLFSIKWVFLVALFLFELGSLLCAVAPSSIVLIIGRAVAGVGSAGLFSGAMVIVAHTVPLSRRPAFLGSIAGVYGVASVAGPLMGGAFTDKVTWRWCFYINLPVGGAAAVGILFLLRLKERKAIKGRKSFFTIVKDLDPVGTLLFMGFAVSLLLALQWGGVLLPWSDGRVIALLVIFGVLLLAFVAVQGVNKKYATIPGRIIVQRSIIGSCLYGVCAGSACFIMIYYIPIWFQAIKGTTAVRSGINSLAMLLPQVFGSMVAGVIVTKVGYYTPFFIMGSLFTAVGAGLCMLFTPETPVGQWVGFQFLLGLGVGLGFQQGTVAAQTVLPLADVPIGTALVVLMQIFGGAIFVAVAQNVFTNRLLENILALNIDGIDAPTILQAGATNLRNLVDSSLLPDVLVAYNDALVKAFRVAVIMASLSMVGSVIVEWRSVKGKKTGGVGAV